MRPSMVGGGSIRLKTPMPIAVSKPVDKTLLLQKRATATAPHVRPDRPSMIQPMMSPRVARTMISVEAWPDEVDADLELVLQPSPSSALGPPSSSSSSSASLALTPPTLNASPADERSSLASNSTASFRKKLTVPETSVALNAIASVMRGTTQPPSTNDTGLPLWERHERPSENIHVPKSKAVDAEMQVFHDAFLARRQTVRPIVDYDCMATQTGQTAPTPRRSIHASPLRIEQMNEIAQIRLAFEKHNIAFHEETFQRALVTPEDKTTVECIEKLPLPGARLLENPRLSQKRRLFGSAQSGQKKKASKKKKGSKRKKSKKT